jgi:spermidine/putrescine transport system permease protein
VFKRAMTQKMFSLPYLVWMSVFIVVPLLLVLYYAFTKHVDGTVVISAEHFLKAFNPVYMRVLLHSILLALITTAICLLLGYPVAYMLARAGRRGRFLLVLVVLPMWMNFLLRTYAWMSLLDNQGIINSFLQWIGIGGTTLMYTEGAVILGMVYNFFPFMVLPLYSVLIKIPRSLTEAAEDLGADSLRVFTRVTLPLSVPGIVTGITMVFMPAVTTFAISRLLGGSQYMLFGDLIENQFLFAQDWSMGSALSIFMIVIILLSMAVLSRYDKGEKGGGILW